MVMLWKSESHMEPEYQLPIDISPDRERISKNGLIIVIADLVTRARRWASAQRRINSDKVRELLSGSTLAARRAMFKRIKKGQQGPAAVLQDPDTDLHTSNLVDICRLIRKAWSPILNRHRQAPPSWHAFVGKCRDHLYKREGAPEDTPSGQELLDSARAVNAKKAAGRDGWRPIELKFLPLEAWEIRARILQMSAALGKYPEPYSHVLLTAIPKKGENHFHCNLSDRNASLV